MEFAGLWHITEMEMWPGDYINMATQAYIKINTNGSGSFQFGLVIGDIDGDVEINAGSERSVFTWEGIDEFDPVFGSGWVKMVGGFNLEGSIKIHLGDSSDFKAQKSS